MSGLPQSASAVTATGGNTTNDIYGYRIHTFTNSATASNFDVTAGGNVEVLVVAGGGGGGYDTGGGGGAGGLIYNNAFPVSAGNYTVTVGAGGPGQTGYGQNSTNFNGSNSVFSTLTALGGGGGGGLINGTWAGLAGADGGSGGGGGGYTAPGNPGSGTSGQGYAGGAKGPGVAGCTGSGGGGAGGVGGTGVNASGGSTAGGIGTNCSISGTTVTYATGGRGSGDGWTGQVGSVPNSGNGGDGGGGGDQLGRAGGSGIVIVKYLMPLPPGIQNLSATNVTAASAWLNGYISSTGGAPITAVAVYWGATDGGDPMSGLWMATNTLAGGPWANGASATFQATGLTVNTIYYYRYYATNSIGPAWASSSEHFLAGNITVTNPDPTAAEPAPDGSGAEPGMLTIQRDPSATNDALTVYYSWAGSSVQEVGYTASPTGTSVTLSAGVASTNITITPLWDPTWNAGDRTVWLVLSPNSYGIGTPASNLVTITKYPFTPGTNITTSAGDWNNSAIWSLGRRPLPGDDVTVKHAVALSNATDCLNSFTITNATLTFSNWNARLSASTVTIRNGATITHVTNSATMTNADGSWPMEGRVWIVCTNLDLQPGGQINAKGLGYRGGNAIDINGCGPGRGTSAGGDYWACGGGGGHGGAGGWGDRASAGGTYDLTSAPIMPGSGGGGRYAGNGGGAVRIDADNGNIIVNGTINVDGNDCGYGGGGSGGSIFITCRTLAGTTNGYLTAKGGRGYTESGGGGGGRIAFIYDPSAQSGQASQPGIRFNAGGGDASSIGMDGTFYLPDILLFTPDLSRFHGVRFYGVTNWSVDSLSLTNRSVAFSESQFALTVTNTLKIDTAILQVGSGILGTEDAPGYAQINCGRLQLVGQGTNQSRFYVYSGPTNAGLNHGARVAVSGDIVLTSNCWIYPVSSGTNGGSVYFTVANVTIDAGGGFNADGLGYNGGPWRTRGYGPGGGSAADWQAAGGGYGGKGGGSSIAYGYTNAPLYPGSGGGGGGYPGKDAGGLIWIKAAGNVVLNGTLQANGLGASGVNYIAGGAGGGILVIAGGVFRSGSNALLSAKGGDIGGAGSEHGGAGGGGRIAIWHRIWEAYQQTILADPNNAANTVPKIIITNDLAGAGFLGSYSVTNGTGTYPGQPGSFVVLYVPPPSGTVVTVY